MFNQMSFSVLENDLSPLQVCVQVQGDLAIPVAISMKSREGTATAPEDFAGADQNFVFIGLSPVEQCFMVNIVDEDLLELDEVFALTLSGPDDVVDIVNGVANVTIHDSSELTIGFESVEDDVTEGGMVMVCVSIGSGRLAEQVSVSVSITPLSGQGEAMVTCMTITAILLYCATLSC